MISLDVINNKRVKLINHANQQFKAIAFLKLFLFNYINIWKVLLNIP